MLLSQNFNGLAKRLCLPSGGSIISQEQEGRWKGWTLEMPDALITLVFHVLSLLLRKKKPIFPLSRCQIYASNSTDRHYIQPRHKDNSPVCRWCHVLDGRTVYSVWKLVRITSGFNIWLSLFFSNTTRFCVSEERCCVRPLMLLLLATNTPKNSDQGLQSRGEHQHLSFDVYFLKQCHAFHGQAYS